MYSDEYLSCLFSNFFKKKWRENIETKFVIFN